MVATQKHTIGFKMRLNYLARYVARSSLCFDDLERHIHRQSHTQSPVQGAGKRNKKCGGNLGAHLNFHEVKEMSKSKKRKEKLRRQRKDLPTFNKEKETLPEKSCKSPPPEQEQKGLVGIRLWRVAGGT
eukprot:1161608-Pelagomonas_calceolata.AAC.1